MRKQKTDRSRIERAAKRYHSNHEAAKSMNLSAGAFGRLCREYKIETPHARQIRQRNESAVQ